MRIIIASDDATLLARRVRERGHEAALSLRLLSQPLAVEIVDAWLDATYEGTEGESLALLDP